MFWLYKLGEPEVALPSLEFESGQMDSIKDLLEINKMCLEATEVNVNIVDIDQVALPS